MVPCSCTTHTGFWQTLFTSSCISPSKHFLFLCSPLQDSETKGMFGWSKSIRCSAVSAQLAYGGVFCCFPQSLIFSNIYGLYRRITLTARRERVCASLTLDCWNKVERINKPRKFENATLLVAFFWSQLSFSATLSPFLHRIKNVIGVFLSWFRFK